MTIAQRFMRVSQDSGLDRNRSMTNSSGYPRPHPNPLPAGEGALKSPFLKGGFSILRSKSPHTSLW